MFQIVTPAVLSPIGIAAAGVIRRLFSSRSWRTCAVILCVGSLWSAEAGAVLIAFGDGTENTENPIFFGWDYAGEVNASSGTYLGDGWVINANHVGPGDLVLDGTVYPWIPGTEVRLRTNPSNLADLVVFGIWPHPNLAPLVIRTTPPPVGEFLIMIGSGVNRGSDASWDPNGPLPPPPEPLVGWNWGSGRAKRWGTNEVESLTTGLISGTVSFYTSFDDSQVLPEAQTANGDSGGAVFSLNAGSTQLAGIIYAAGPTPGQTPGTALFTNLTFVARLDFYRAEIEAITAVPTSGPVSVPLSPHLWLFLAGALAVAGARTAGGPPQVGRGRVTPG